MEIHDNAHLHLPAFVTALNTFRLDDDYMGRDPEVTLTTLERMLRSPTTLFLGAYEDGRYRSFLKAFHQPGSDLSTRMMLWVVMTAPDSRGRGYARRLIEHLIDLARRRGVRSLTLEVAQRNVVAIKLYKSLGFEKVGVVHDSFRRADGLHNLVIYELRIAEPHSVTA